MLYCVKQKEDCALLHGTTTEISLIKSKHPGKNEFYYRNKYFSIQAGHIITGVKFIGVLIKE